MAMDLGVSVVSKILQLGRVGRSEVGTGGVQEVLGTHFWEYYRSGGTKVPPSTTESRVGCR